MPQYRYDPPLDKLGPHDSQLIELLDGRSPIARAAWQPLAAVPGACQLLWAEVIPELRRRGNGSLVLGEVMRQAKLHARSTGRPLRRMMLLIPQPDVIGRAWLAKNGFLHVNTLNDLGAGGEVLVMIRTFS